MFECCRRELPNHQYLRELPRPDVSIDLTRFMERDWLLRHTARFFCSSSIEPSRSQIAGNARKVDHMHEFISPETLISRHVLYNRKPRNHE